MKETKNILVAPLNWGLGHATRCIPIIRALSDAGFTPIVASDGNALVLLQKEFPELLALALPSYEIEYAKKGENFKWKLLKNSPKTLAAIYHERQLAKKWVKEYQLCGIISDNRLGVYSKKVPSVIITHQLTVLSGKTTWISSKLHHHFIKKFTECWVPDTEGIPNLSGKLGHPKKGTLSVKYIGVLSRFEKKDLPITHSLLVLLSGPEPQRTLLETKLLEELKHFEGNVLFVRGVMEAERSSVQQGSIEIHNYMVGPELNEALNRSEIVLSRSGYTTIMDLAKLGKKAFFIPTPGQTEQEYLAKKLQRDGLVPMKKQTKFECNDLDVVPMYRGLFLPETTKSLLPLFALFEGE